jgi:hypothetical protein
VQLVTLMLLDQVNEQKLLDFTRDCFLETQLAWGQQDLEKLSKILHPQLLVLWKAQIDM